MLVVRCEPPMATPARLLWQTVRCAWPDRQPDPERAVRSARLALRALLDRPNWFKVHGERQVVGQRSPSSSTPVSAEDRPSESQWRLAPCAGRSAFQVPCRHSESGGIRQERLRGQVNPWTRTTSIPTPPSGRPMAQAARAPVTNAPTQVVDCPSTPRPGGHRQRLRAWSSVR